jgi:hypothetical protein
MHHPIYIYTQSESLLIYLYNLRKKNQRTQLSTTIPVTDITNNDDTGYRLTSPNRYHPYQSYITYSYQPITALHLQLRRKCLQLLRRRIVISSGKHSDLSSGKRIAALPLQLDATVKTGSHICRYRS